MKFNSIRFKISVLYVIILGIILITYSAVLYLGLHYTLYDELDEELAIKASEISDTIRLYSEVFGGSESAFFLAAQRVISLEEESPPQKKTVALENQWMQKVDKWNLKEDYIILLSLTGEPMAQSATFQPEYRRFFLKDIKPAQIEEAVFKSIKFSGRDLRLISVPLVYQGQKRYLLQIGTSLKPVIHLLRNRLVHIAISIPVILLLASFAGRIFAASILKPVKVITRTAETITEQDLSARVKTEHVDEEMRYLVEAFNEMISRLERSFTHIAEFSSHVAHELKTPLAIMRGESEVALRKKRSPEEYKRVIRINLEEIERMLKMIEDLFLLTKLDYQPEIFKFEEFDLCEFFQEIYEQHKMLVAEKNINTNLRMYQKALKIKGDKLHLRRLFFNLLDNARKFTPREGTIDIAIKRQGHNALIAISDTGTGIAREDLSKIFDRFFHKDMRGSESDPGSGLGLSIARAIANIHDGTIGVVSEPGKGATFTVTLPLV